MRCRLGLSFLRIPEKCHAALFVLRNTVRLELVGMFAGESPFADRIDLDMKIAGKSRKVRFALNPFDFNLIHYKGCTTLVQSGLFPF